jgi:NAD(P)-dependent dehydrogenase (short-subunit alcohol dehydrogenase family)
VVEEVTVSWLEPFRESVVLVTGASSGIGHATALAFAHAGARVAVAARRKELLDELAAQAGRDLLVLPTDVTRRDEVAACIDTVHQRFGRVDVVVNNAGVLIPGRLDQIAADDLDTMLRVNLFGQLFVMQEALRVMGPRGDGVIVNVASLAGRRGYTPLGGYCATKFALVGLTEAVREELAERGIHAALVLPGIVETPMVEQVTQDDDFLTFWPRELNMPPSWVVWAIFAAARFRLLEVSVPPGTATLEKLAALTPGVADKLVQWARGTAGWLSRRLHGERP